MSKDDAIEKIPSLLAGVAGEYFVAAELSRRGYIASISLRNTRGIDLLVTNQDGSRNVTIQCKTNQVGRKKWILNFKSETFHCDNHFYVFVVLGAMNSRPSYHIVPSNTVAEFTTTSHQKWLQAPGLSHHDNPVRNFIDQNDEFLERWDLLGL